MGSLIRTAAGRAALATVVLFGGLLGYFVWYSFGEYVSTTYPLSWRASWITTSHPEVHQSYYRKKIYLTGRVKQAWLSVMGPDDVQVYVNGARVGGGSQLYVNVAGVFDLTGKFQPGTNLIAVTVHRSTYPGPSDVAIEGAYIDWSGVTTRIASDGAWKVFDRAERQPGGGHYWYEAAFNDVAWPKAVVGRLAGPADKAKVNTPPELYTHPFEGRWCWTHVLAARRAAFRTALPRVFWPKEAWIRISGQQAYRVSINGVPVINYDSRIGELASLPASKQQITLYNISPYLSRWRGNILAVEVFGERGTSRLLVDGFIRSRTGEDYWFGTAKGWRATDAAGPGWTDRNYDDLNWPEAVGVGTMSTPEETALEKTLGTITMPSGYSTRLMVLEGFTIVPAILFVLWIWWKFSAWSARRSRQDLSETLISLSLSTLPPLLFLAVDFLLGWDYRLDTAFPYRPASPILAGMIWWVSLVALAVRNRSAGATEPEPKGGWLARHTRPVSIGILFVLFAVGITVRLNDLDFNPMGGDEVTMSLYAKGTIKRGYPNIDITSHIPTKMYTTSELVPYPMALGVLLFEKARSLEYGLRFPGVIFSVLTLLLLFHTGRDLGGIRTGLLAAGVYLLMPLAINMAQFARYPAQLQFFSLLTAHWFYRYLTREGEQKKYAYLSLLAIVLTYLSWEGAALVVPALFVGMLTVKRKDVSWLKDPYLWGVIGIFALIVLLQLSNRLIVNRGLMVVGTGTANISLTPQWLQPMFDALVFADNFLFLKNNKILSEIVILGVVFWKRDRRLSYYGSIMLVVLALMTGFIEVRDFRHVYYLLPYLILCGVMSLEHFLDLLIRPWTGLGLERRLRIAAWAGFAILFLMTTNDTALKLLRMPGAHSPVQAEVGIGDSAGIREARDYIKAHTIPGAVTISNLPHIIYVYYGSADYYAENKLQVAVVIAQDEPVAMHRVTGSPLIYTLEDLKDVLARYPQVWFVVTKAFDKFYGVEFADYIQTHFNLVDESTGVWLYEWRH